MKAVRYAECRFAGAGGTMFLRFSTYSPLQTHTTLAIWPSFSLSGWNTSHHMLTNQTHFVIFLPQILQWLLGYQIKIGHTCLYFCKLHHTWNKETKSAASMSFLLLPTLSCMSTNPFFLMWSNITGIFFFSFHTTNWTGRPSSTESFLCTYKCRTI